MKCVLYAQDTDNVKTGSICYITNILKVVVLREKWICLRFDI